jgi:hypothetical protein
MIPPGVWSGDEPPAGLFKVAALAIPRSDRCQRRELRCARRARSLVRGFRRCLDPRDRATSRARAFDGSRNLESPGYRGPCWPLPEGMGDAELEAALYANHRSKRGYRRHPEPDWPAVHRELKRKHVTLLMVWDEYIAANPGGYSSSRFCELYRGSNRSCRRRCGRPRLPANGCSLTMWVMVCRSWSID